MPSDCPYHGRIDPLLWKITFKAALSQRVLDDLEAVGINHFSGYEAIGASSPTAFRTHAFLVPAARREDVAPLVMRVLDRHLITVKTFAVQSTPVR